MICRVHCLWALGGSLLLTLPLEGAQNVVPPPFPLNRYDKMIKNSPFVVATAPAAPTEVAPGFAVNLYVMGLAKFKNPDGTEYEFVTIKDRQSQATFSLSGKEPNADKIALSTVEWNNVARKSKVTITKGGEFATIEFDQESAPSIPPPPGGVRPGGGIPQPGRPMGGLPPSPENPGQRNPNSRVQQVIPNPGIQQQQQLQQQQRMQQQQQLQIQQQQQQRQPIQPVQPQVPERRRIRPIISQP